jgi:hypothetical protein
VSREDFGMHAADRHGRLCARGGASIAVHNATAALVARVAAEWGLSVACESKEFLPPNSAFKIDVLVRGAGEGGRYLAVDVTRREGELDVEGAGAAAADRDKQRYYEQLYSHPVTVRGFAMDHRGRLGEGAREVVRMLAEAGARMSDGHVEDLERELLTRLAAETQHNLAYLYARAAAVNRVEEVGVPRLTGLRVCGPLFYALPRAVRRAAQPAGNPGRYVSCWRETAGAV